MRLKDGSLCRRCGRLIVEYLGDVVRYPYMLCMFDGYATCNLSLCLTARTRYEFYFKDS